MPLNHLTRLGMVYFLSRSHPPSVSMAPQLLLEEHHLPTDRWTLSTLLHKIPLCPRKVAANLSFVQQSFSFLLSCHAPSFGLFF